VEIQPKQPTAHGPAETFTGDVWFDVIAAGVSPSRLRVSTMRFSPSAHTAWHRHANGQTLHIAEGRRFVQARGGPVIEVRPGDTIYTPPGRHWQVPPLIIHLAFYAGWSRAMSAITVAKNVFGS
jgi:quercetin dioxygenase-like cupin family protein